MPSRQLGSGLRRADPAPHGPDTCQVIEKHTFDAFFETELRGFLRFQQIETLYVAGVETNVCVLFAACTALSNGFDTVILTECVTTSRLDVHE
jgi:nicotinamidase-related amidase